MQLRETLFALVLLCSFAHAKAAPPILGPDCGAGATITASSTKDAGEIIIGAGSSGCTVAVSWPVKPACSAMVERTTDPTSQVYPYPLGTIATTTGFYISDASGSMSTMQAGYVVSYMCMRP